MPASVRRSIDLLAVALVALVGSAGSLTAQAREAHRHTPTPPKAAGASAKDRDAADPTHAAHDAMSGAMTANPHMRMSPDRVASADDSARASQLVVTARGALAKYKDVDVAEREGYRMFAPNVKNQPVYHFTQFGAAVRAQYTFDAARPTSLLYKKQADGKFRLVGAMYTAPREASLQELDARVPLGIARWHLHTNMCVPRLAQQKRWREFSDGKPVFGPMSPIATEEACEAVNGRFLPVVMNWMVHANVFETDVWGDHH
jgi:hypothetical protein